MRNNIRVIAMYLPQYHPFPENDEWWGKGFTEWTNVAKAKPLFKGHYQPKIPADLGFYDLRVPETREQQAQMAREAGIEGFMYWHYWFEGHELMQRPWNEVVASGNPDFPFCIGWANETWMNKMWNKDGSLSGGKVLIKQTYSEEDDIIHFNRLLPAFKDHRYILVDGAPLVFVHRGIDLPRHTLAIWNKMAVENGFPNIHFVGRLTYSEYEKYGIEYLKDRGFNAVTIARLGNSLLKDTPKAKALRHIKSIINRTGCPRTTEYCRDMKFYCEKEIDIREDVYPAIYPNWDHSPRSGKSSVILLNSTPELFGDHCREIFSVISNKEFSHQICFLKSWNEWGEGNYVEPDIKYGDQYLQRLKKALSD